MAMQDTDQEKEKNQRDISFNTLPSSCRGDCHWEVTLEMSD